MIKTKRFQRSRRSGRSRRTEICGWSVLVMLILLLCPLLMGCADSGDSEPVPPETARIAVLTGATDELVARETYPDADILCYNDAADCMAALKNGRVDYTMVTNDSFSVYHRADTNYRAASEVLREAPSYFVLKKGNTELAEAINALLAQYREDGFLDDVYSRYMEASGDYEVHTFEFPEDGEVLTAALVPSMEPISFLKDGELIGSDVEILSRLAADMGRKLEIATMDFAALIPYIQSGKADVGACLLNYSEERAQAVDFTDSYMSETYFLAEYREDSGEVPSHPDPVHARIGNLNGSILAQICQTQYPDAKYSYFTALGDCMLSLKSGVIDYAALSYLDAGNYMRTNPGFVTCEQLPFEIPVSAAFPKGSEYCGEVSGLIDGYRQDGTLDRIYANWVRSDDTPYIFEEIPEAPADAPVLLIATGDSFEPTSFIMNGELVGYDIELGKRIAYDLGMRAEFVTMDFGSLIAYLQSGKADMVLCAMMDTEERRQIVDFSSPYLIDSAYLLTYEKPSEPEPSFWESLKTSFEKTFIREGRWKMILSGIGITLLISVGSAVLGLMLSIGVCAMKRSHSKILSGIAKGYVRIVQGTPMVVLLMIFYYIVFNKTGLDGIEVSIIAFAINFSAYVSEIFSNAIDAVDRGQWEAAYAIGFGRGKTFTKVILPQAMRYTLPLLHGELVSLVKATAIVGYVAVEDLTKVGDIIRSLTYEAFFPLIATAVIYFLLSWALASVLTLAEIRTNPNKKKHITAADADKGGQDA